MEPDNMQLPSTSTDHGVPVYRAEVGFGMSSQQRAHNEWHINQNLGHFISSICGGISQTFDGRPVWSNPSMVQPLFVPSHPTTLLISVPNGSTIEEGQTVKTYPITPVPINASDAEASIHSESGYWLEPWRFRNETPFERKDPGGSAAISFEGSRLGGVEQSDHPTITLGKMVFHDGPAGSQSKTMLSKFIAGTVSAKLPNFPGQIADFRVMGKFASQQGFGTPLYRDLERIAALTQPVKIHSQASLGMVSANTARAEPSADGLMTDAASVGSNWPTPQMSQKAQEGDDDSFFDFSAASGEPQGAEN